MSVILRHTKSPVSLELTMSGRSNEHVDIETGSIASDYSYVESGGNHPKKRLEFDDNDDGSKDIREMPEKIVPYLAGRACHIPGNTYSQDWFQYCFANNHPLFGLFCHYKYHPVSQFERLLVFLSSVAATLTVSHAFMLLFLWRDGRQALEESVAGVPQINVARHEVATITVGALIVTLFDFSIWYIAACGCCEAGGKLQKLHKASVLGTVVLAVIFVGVAIAATILMLLYGSYNNDTSLDTDQLFENGLSALNYTAAFVTVGTNANISKWKKWFIQLGLSMFVYDVIVATIIFTGILGCIPFIGAYMGGRPAEVKRAERKKRKAHRKGKRKSKRKKRKSSDEQVPSP